MEEDTMTSTLNPACAGQVMAAARRVLRAVNAPPTPFAPPEYQLMPGDALLLAGFGSAPEHATSTPTCRPPDNPSETS
jgi:hypothetical protein